MLNEIITYTDPDSTAAEAIRSLRTNILFLSADKAVKIIGITSPGPEEGKSFLAVNLATVTARSHKKTLLIDCDLRRMGLSRLFGLSGKEGLSSILTGGQVSFKELPLYDVGIDNLVFLPCGPQVASSSEVLSEEAMDNILSIAREEFDIVYLDIPPVLAVTDSIIVSKKADGVILTVMADITPAKAAARAYKILKETGINIIGAVLNKVNRGISDSKYRI